LGIKLLFAAFARAVKTAVPKKRNMPAGDGIYAFKRAVADTYQHKGWRCSICASCPQVIPTGVPVWDVQMLLP